MYLYEGNEISYYFLATGDTVEKNCKKTHFPVFADAENDPTSTIHKNVRGADICMKISVYILEEVFLHIA